jgi:hypothetical protein
VFLGNIPDDGGDLFEARLAGGPPAPLPDQNLIVAFLRNDDDRLEDARFLDRPGKLVDRDFIEFRPRLERIRPDPVDLEFGERLFLEDPVFLRDEGFYSFAERLFHFSSISWARLR